jgi:hypothetical protein
MTTASCMSRQPSAIETVAILKSNKLTTESQRTQSRIVVFVKDLLCVLCVFAVIMFFMGEYKTDSTLSGVKRAS